MIHFIGWVYFNSSFSTKFIDFFPAYITQYKLIISYITTNLKQIYKIFNTQLMKYSIFSCLVFVVLCSIVFAGPKVTIISPRQLAAKFERNSKFPLKSFLSIKRTRWNSLYSRQIRKGALWGSFHRWLSHSRPSRWMQLH